MLPEFKASSKRLNIVCNLEAEKKKGQNTANPTKWNDSINATRAHNTTVFIDNIMTKQMHTPGGLRTRRNTDSKDAVNPINQQQHVESRSPCPSAHLMAGGCVSRESQTRQLNFACSSSGDLTHFKEK